MNSMMQKKEIYVKTKVMKLHLLPQQLANIRDALELAAAIKFTEDPEVLLDYICTDFADQKREEVFSRSEE